MNHSCEVEREYKLVIERFSELLLFLCIFNAVSAALSVVGNSLVVLAIWRTPSLHSPSYVLLSGLALSDLGVGLIAQPTFVGSNIALIKGNCDCFSQLFKVRLSATDMFFAVTGLTLCAVSFDRFPALKIHLRYQEFVTVRRILLLLSSIWMLATVYTTWMALHRSSAILFSAVKIAVLLLFSLWCYFKIFQTVRHHRSQIQNLARVSQLNGDQTLPNITRYQKSVRSLLYIVSLFLVSCLPWVCFIVARHTSADDDSSDIFLIVKLSIFTLTYLNSCINPLLYCWRMGEVRQAVKRILRVTN